VTGALGLGASLGLRPWRGAAGATPTPTPTPTSVSPFDFSGGAMPSGAVLTRASEAWVTGADGRPARAGVDVGRFDRDPADGSVRGLLLEGATTNRLVRSEALDAGEWGRQGAAVAGNFTAGPEGQGSAAGLIVELGGSDLHGLWQDAGVSEGQALAASVYVRPEGRQRGVLVLRSGGGAELARAAFDLTTGTVTGAGGRVSIRRGANNWFRVAAWGTADANSVRTELWLADGSGSERYTASDSGGFFVWGAMLESGPEVSAGPTSYVSSGAAQGTRAADRLVLDWGARGAADGAAGVRLGFDDGSSATVAATIASGRWAVPVPMARPWLKRAELI